MTSDDHQSADTAFANAGRLLKDAGYLAQDKRLESAIALAVLGVEELGKHILGLWYEGESESKPKGKVSRHVCKQVVVASLLLAQDDVARYKGDVGTEATEEFAQLLAATIEDTPVGRLLTVLSLGSMDRAKQTALYRDDLQGKPTSISIENRETVLLSLFKMANDGADGLKRSDVMRVAKTIYEIVLSKTG